MQIRQKNFNYETHEKYTKFDEIIKEFKTIFVKFRVPFVYFVVKFLKKTYLELTLSKVFNRKF